jgi:RNA-binding protein
MLDKKQRIFLRSKAQLLEDIVQIGKDGMTDNVIKQVSDNLYAHELIKIKVQNNCDEDLEDLAHRLAEATDSEIVTTIGTKIVLYKLSKKQKIKHVL